MIECKSTTPDTISGRIGGALIGALVLVLGFWIVRMGYDGKTPAEPIRPEHISGFILMGVLFVWGGIQTIILSLGGNRLPRWVHALMLSIFLLVLGSMFVVFGIMDPEGSSGSVSICGITLYPSQGILTNRIVAFGVGSLCLGLVPFVWRWPPAKKR